MATATGRLKKRIRIERPVPDTSLDGAGSGTWAFVAEVAAEVLDTLPSRSEKLTDGINLATRPSRVRIRRRGDVDPAMRMLIGRWVKGDDDQPHWITDRVTQIISGPADVESGRWSEFMAEDYRPAGNAA